MQKRTQPSNAAALPIPKVNILSSADYAHKGATANPTAPLVVSFNRIQIVAMDIPLEMFDPAYDLKVELLRWRKRSNKRLASGRYQARTGWVHPSHWDGATSIPGLSVRGGGHFGQVGDVLAGGVSLPTSRRTEASLVGLAPNASLSFPVAKVFGGWFRWVKHRDSSGNAIALLAYIRGDGMTRNGVGGFLRVSNHSQFGRFAFRYTIVDPVNPKLRISGPASQPLLIGTALPAQHVNTGVTAIPGKVVNPAMDFGATGDAPRRLIARLIDAVPGVIR